MAIRAASGRPKDGENQRKKAKKRLKRPGQDAILGRSILHTRDYQNQSYQQAP